MFNATIKRFKAIALGFALLAMLAMQVAHAAAFIESMDVNTMDSDKVRLQLKMSGPVSSPKSFSLDNPSRVVFDFPNVRNHLSKKDSRVDFNFAALKRVSVVESAGKTRVVVDLKGNVPFDVKTQGNEVNITISGLVTPTQSTGGFYGQVFSDRKVTNPNNQVRTIDFTRGSQGEAKVVVDLSNAKIPVDIKEEGQRIRVRFLDAKLPRPLERKLDVTDFGTPVSFINTVQQGSNIEMLIQTNGSSENMSYQTDKRFTVEVRPVNKDGEIRNKPVKYTGEKLSLNFQDIEVRAVLQLIADFTGLNIVSSDSVTGNVTIRLRNVPWDQALDIILKTKGLAKRQMGNVLLIGPSEELAAREKLELQSSQQVQDLSPLHAEYIQVNYAKASELAGLLKTDKNSLLSTRGTVSVDERTNTLLVQDTAAKLEEVKGLVRRLDIPIRQVLIESRIVFANDNFQDALGVSWGAAAKLRPGNEPVLGGAGQVLGPGGTGASTVALGADPATVNVGDRLAVDLLPAITPLANNIVNAGFGLTIARLPGGTILDLELQALESEGLGKIVASPRLVTSNQQMAYIESGEEIPYLETTSSGAASVAFKKAVLRLEVTPQITPDDHIIMDLKVNQDSRGEVTNGVPAINTREMHTKVLVANGETVVLGGIYQQTKTDQRARIPFFGKLPVIGWMFRSESRVDQRNELMIFVTPKIIQEGVATS